MLMSQAARMKKSPKVTATRGHTAEGTYNFTSTQPPIHPVMTQLDNTTDIGDTEATFPDVEETFAYQVQDNVGARMDSFEEVENIGSNEHRAERVREEAILISPLAALFYCFLVTRKITGFASFSEAPVFSDPNGSGLRLLSRAQIDSVLDLAKCTIVSEPSNEVFDSYVLSESSLFVYPYKIVIKTCGTTKLLLAIPRILELAEEISLPLAAVKYSC
ncbi:hypothetical protein GUJ93_ZPchr0002g24003 [Zizania palustris]|uniref:Adenosylmethionine decarboxylase n=1 Tax=Zizania palustris TaxID=103762 RepID=A0A8J5VAN4_ZIZPA|nr:hypothetical protein GUJ93_ZPchr0002g24003 [Zizania palustris]